MKRVISLILIGILSLPTIFGLNHYLFEEHVVCSEENAHFHEAEISCSTCDFLRANSEFSSEDSTFLIKDFSITISMEIANLSVRFFFSTNSNSNNLASFDKLTR